MKQRTMKRLGLFLCSCVMATTAAFAAGSLNANEVNASAEAVTPKGTAVGTLGADGLYSTTMTQIAPVGGVAANVQNVYFEGFSEGTFFLTEFTGKSAPNFAIHATQAYSAWNAETLDTAGLLITQRSEKDTGLYDADSLVVSNGFFTKSRYSNKYEEMWATKDFTGIGPGLNNLLDDETYVMITGAYGTAGFVRNFEYYLFTLSDEGVLEQVNHLNAPMNTGAAAGSTAVIYPTIGEEEKAISFKYSMPADSVASLAEGLSESVPYKTQLLSLLDNGVEHTSLSRTNATLSGTSLTASGVEYIEMDMAEGNTTYLMVDFASGNVPNIAFNATKGFATWNGEAADTAGVLFAPSTLASISTNQGAALSGFTSTKTQILQSLSTNPQKNWRPYLGHLQSQSAWTSSVVGKERYIMLIGFTFSETGNETINLKIYSVNNNTLYDYIDVSSSFNYATVKNSKLVLYGNMDTANAAIYNPSGVCFKYSQPADSIENLIKGLGNNYEYKKLLADKFDVQLSTGTVTVKNEAGATITSESVNGSYTLPASQTAGFIGYEVGGELYAAGDVIAVNSDVTATEVTLDFAMTAGARVRAKEGDGHYGGLRFETTVSAAKMETWADEIALYGVVIPTDAIDGEFDIDEAGSKKVALTSFKAGEKNTYYITLTDVYYYNYNRAFSARAYAEVTYADGDKAQFATAYTEKDNSRSVYEVAKAALADAGKYTETEIGYLKNYVNYVVDLTSDGSGNLVLLDNTVTTYEIVNNGDGTYKAIVKDVPAHIASTEYIPVSIWEEVEGELVVTRIVVAAAALTDGDLVSENFQ